jgi:hypothetical protein
MIAAPQPPGAPPMAGLSWPRGQPDSLAVLDARGTFSLWKRNARPVSAAARCAAASRNLSPSLYVSPMSGEPGNFNARAMAQWLASHCRSDAKRQPPGSRPTLGTFSAAIAGPGSIAKSACTPRRPFRRASLLRHWSKFMKPPILRSSGSDFATPRMGGHAYRLSAIPHSGRVLIGLLKSWRKKIRSAISPGPVRLGSDHWVPASY